MKKVLLILALCAALPEALLAHRIHTGKTFLFTRPAYRDIASQQFIWHSIEHRKPHCMQGAFQAVLTYENSLSSNRAREYFLFNHKQVLVVKGDSAPQFSNRDIRAEWLGLDATFLGSYSINPRQRQVGLWLEYSQELTGCFGCSYFDNYWINIAFPAQYVENHLNLTQYIDTPNAPNTVPNDIIQGLTSTSFNFGKMWLGKKKTSGIAELTAKLGTTFMYRDGFELAMYYMVVIPTAHGQHSEFLFSPFLGNDRHVGVGLGAHFQLPLTKDTSCGFPAFFFNGETIFFLSRKEYRTLDLRFKPYTRYLLLNSIYGETNLLGINILTRKVKVNAYNSAEISTGIRWCGINLETEGGFDLYLRSEERLKLREEFPYNTYGIAGNGATFVDPNTGITVGATASKSTIQFQAANDVDANSNPTFVAIKTSDLNLKTGAADVILNFKVHGAIGYKIAGESLDSFVGIGGFIEAPYKNTDLLRWGVWGKTGITF